MGENREYKSDRGGYSGKPSGGAGRKGGSSGKGGYAGKRDGGKKPYAKRDGDKPYGKRDGERSFDKGSKKPYEKRDGGRTFEKRDGSRDRKFEKRDGDRKFEKREGGRDRKFDKRDGKPGFSKFEKRDIRSDFRKKDYEKPSFEEEVKTIPDEFLTYDEIEDLRTLPGMEVTHKDFGRGIIDSIDESGLMRVRFREVGLKAYNCEKALKTDTLRIRRLGEKGEK